MRYINKSYFETEDLKKCLNCGYWERLPTKTLEDILLIMGDCTHFGGKAKSTYSCKNWKFNVHHVDNFTKQELADIITAVVRLGLEIETSQEYY